MKSINKKSQEVKTKIHASASIGHLIDSQVQVQDENNADYDPHQSLFGHDTSFNEVNHG